MGTISEKLTYLNTTKQKIKQGINSLGGKITNDTTFRNYATELDSIYNKLPKVSGIGTNLSLSPTLEARLGLIPRGNTEQDGTLTPTSPIMPKVVTGENGVKIENKNLFDVATSRSKHFVNKNNGNIGDSDNWSASDYIEIEPNTAYIYSGVANTWSSVAGTCFYDENKIFISSIGSQPQTFTTPANAKYVRLSLNTETPTNVQLEKGSTATDYVEHKEQNYPLNLISKNLFKGVYNKKQFGGGIPLTNIPANITINSSDDNSINYTLNGNDYLMILTDVFKLQPLTEYTISYKNSVSSEVKGNTFRFYVYNYGLNENVPTTNIDERYEINGSGYWNDGNKEITFTTPENGQVAFGWGIGNTSNGGTIDISDIQLEEGTTATAFESYYNYELAEIGDYADYIEGTPDNWVKKETIKKEIFSSAKTIQGDGTNTIRADLTSTPTYLKFDGATTENPCLYCDRFIFANNTQDNEHIYVATWQQVSEGYLGNARIYLKHDRLSGYSSSMTNAQKLELVNNYLASNSLTCYLIISEPTDVPITDTTLINQLNALYYARSYDDETNISTSYEEGNMPMKINASALKGI